jgi:hypothetical protein
MAEALAADQRPKLELVRAIKNDLADLHFTRMDPGQVHRDELSATLWYLMGYAGLAAQEAQVGSPELARQLVALRESIEGFRKIMLSGRPQVTDSDVRRAPGDQEPRRSHVHRDLILHGRSVDVPASRALPPDAARLDDPDAPGLTRVTALSALKRVQDTGDFRLASASSKCKRRLAMRACGVPGNSSTNRVSSLRPA